MVAKQALFLVVTLGGLVFLTFGTNIFETTFTDNQTGALITMTKLYLAASMYCFIVSELAKNYSQVDKFWSLIPIAYVWYFTNSAGFEPRMVLMSVLATIWGVRLTLNFARRGGFSIYFWKGEEDYRWIEVRKAMPFLSNRITWGLFNLFFICLYQMGLIFLFTLPILAAWQGSEPLYWADYLIGALMFLFIVIETMSDQQQYEFQSEKYKRINDNEELRGDYKRGFRTTGLWSFSRHPNFTCEQLIWVMFYLFSASANGQWLNWSIVGCVLLIVLFYNSAVFSEGISSRKYPDYKKYQENVPMFIGLANRDWK